MKYYLTILGLFVLLALSLNAVKGQEPETTAGHVKTKEGISWH